MMTVGPWFFNWTDPAGKKYQQSSGLYVKVRVHNGTTQLSCTSLTDEEFNKFVRPDFKWICAKCTAAEAGEDNDEDTQIIIIEELTEEGRTCALLLTL